jgi:hypothetical protein
MYHFSENDASLSQVEKAHRKASLMMDTGLGTFSNTGSTLFPSFANDPIDSVGSCPRFSTKTKTLV